MSSVDLQTITGDAYSYEGVQNVIVHSPFGVFSFRQLSDGKAEGIVGTVEPFEARKMEGRALIDEDVEFEAYVSGESIFVPVEEVDEFQLGTAYVMNGEELFKLQDQRFLRPELLGGEQSNERVIEVYQFAYPNPHSVEDSFEPDFVSYEDVVEAFRDNQMERVCVVK